MNRLRHILHADFDAFFTSIEQRDTPQLKGKPVVVGGSPESRGVVASASYEARRFGIRSAMPMRTAFQKCRNLVRLDARSHRYKQVSRDMMAIFRDVTPLVEPLSIDEAYLDITDSVKGSLSPKEIAYDLKSLIELKTGLTISVGVSTSKSVSKIASDMDKPNGLTVVTPGSERSFLAPLPVSTLYGVGPKTTHALAEYGVCTIADIASISDEWLQQHFGRFGPYMKRLAIGDDDSSVETKKTRKSLSFENTMIKDTDEADLLFDLVDRLSQKIGLTLIERKSQARTVRVKLRLSDFTTFTRQMTPPEPVFSASDITRTASELVRRELTPGRLFRLVGVSVSDLRDSEPDTYQPRLTGLE